jgi:hypothetical protein
MNYQKLKEKIEKCFAPMKELEELIKKFQLTQFS